MRTLLAALSLGVLPAPAWAGGLPSVNDPRIFQIAICGVDYVNCTIPLLTATTPSPGSNLWFFSALTSGGQSFTFETFTGQPFGRHANGIDRYGCVSCAGGSNIYLEVRTMDGNKWDFGIFERLPHSTVPEPASMTLLATGLVGIGGAAAAGKRRRMKPGSQSRAPPRENAPGFRLGPAQRT